MNIVINGVATNLLELISGGIDLERVFAVYWEARKEAHIGRLPGALDHESWESFCEADPDAATAFIGPFRQAMLSLTERGDVQGEYDLVPTGSWIPRQQVRVVTPVVLYQERKPAARVEKLFSAEKDVSR